MSEEVAPDIGFDLDDALDKVVNIESQLYKEAVEQGELDAIEEEGKENCNDAFCTGYARGFAVGLEVAFYEEALKSLSQTSPPLSSANLRYKSQMMDIISSITCVNDPERDISGDLEKLRSYYKLLNEPAGRFFFASDSKGSVTNEW